MATKIQTLCKHVAGPYPRSCVASSAESPSIIWSTPPPPPVCCSFLLGGKRLLGGQEKEPRSTSACFDWLTLLGGTPNKRTFRPVERTAKYLSLFLLTLLGGTLTSKRSDRLLSPPHHTRCPLRAPLQDVQNDHQHPPREHSRWEAVGGGRDEWRRQRRLVGCTRLDGPTYICRPHFRTCLPTTLLLFLTGWWCPREARNTVRPFLRYTEFSFALCRFHFLMDVCVMSVPFVKSAGRLREACLMSVRDVCAWICVFV